MARDFNGTSDFIARGSPVVNATPLTMACWFNSDSVAANQKLISIKASASNNGWALAARGDQTGDPVRAESFQASATPAQAASATGYTAGSWFHAAAVFASSTSRTAYLNGVAGTTDTTSSAPAGTRVNTIIGAHTDVSGVQTAFFDGRIAEASIWSAALTADEIASLAKGASPLLVRPQSLAFYAPLVTDGTVELKGAPLSATGTTVAAHCAVLNPRPAFVHAISAATQTLVNLAQAAWTWTGRAVSVNAQTAVALAQAGWAWLGRPLASAQAAFQNLMLFFGIGP